MTRTAQDTKEFYSWYPEGGFVTLREVCLLHDVPLHITETYEAPSQSDAEGHPLPTHYTCVVTCPTCARPVTLLNTVDVRLYEESRHSVDQLIEDIQRDLRVLTVYQFYLNIRDGWRQYDHWMAENQH